MRSTPIKAPKRTLKSTTKKPVSTKRKKMPDVKSPIRDTISETISFVIKGKLTPIKPIMIDNKLDIITKTNKKPQRCGKVLKMRACKKQDSKKVSKKQKDNSKAPTKVQIKAAKKPSAQTIKTSAETVVSDVSPTTPFEKVMKESKIEKSKIRKRVSSKVKTETTTNTKKIPAKKSKLKSQKKNTESVDTRQADEIKKQQTIEKLLKQANDEMTAKKVTLKDRKIKKVKKEVKVESKKVKKSTDLEEPTKTADYTSDEISLKELSERRNDSTEKEDNKQETKANTPVKRKIKTKPKMTLIKKRVVGSKNKNGRDEKCKTKLFGFWNGPKRHRVASLNALAKVHCLYENETRGNMLDIIDEANIKREYVSKKETSKKDASKVAIKKESAVKKETDSDVEDNYNFNEEDVIPTRTLRTLPGLRAVGKHWDMHETSSSSDENSGNESSSESIPPVKVKNEKAVQQTHDNEKEETETIKGNKRKRNRNEIMMDLKDMVVRKRMASLNASAILAASYSVEKRSSKWQRDTDDSDSGESGSSEEYFAASDDDIKDEEDVKKEDDRKLIEVHTTPNKKVAVILNQDTDVTITGVYVNSTTRSTHHEGYCSIAGMQYRISATSHTQTAATAVATETLLQSSSSSAPDNSNSDSMPSSKSYTPLDALSNMQPPPGPGIQHNHPVLHGQQHSMGPPQHVLPMPPHQISPGRRHSCSSAFSSPHSGPNYQLPSGHAPMQGEPGYGHGYYQPAGPLITVPHGHGQPPPPPLPVTKSAPLSEPSPTPTTPLTSHDPPPPPSSNGDSSDSEVIITSVTTAKDAVPPPSHPPTAYRYSQYASPHPGYSYNYPPPYHYPTPPPPPNPSYAHHDLCYPLSPYVHHKYPSYRRYSTAPYFQANPQEIYPVPPTGPSQQSQQVVTATPVSASGTAFPTAGGPPPPPTILDTYPTPQAALVETYQPPPHYYSPAYGPAPPCYTHSPSRTIPYLNPSYQSCPCPMQSCPKNVLTGPLTGDSKRSNISAISKDSIPLPPVALALPLEPASATGPPSPARGSAGMPPPPSPAGATYQPPPPPTKQESHSPDSQDDPKTDKKRKARVGKAMVRNNIQQNTMLLMCNPNNYISTVKREIESPKEKEIEHKKDLDPVDNEIKIPVGIPELKNICIKSKDMETFELEQHIEPKEEKCIEDKDENSIQSILEEPESEEVLQPIVNTVAENVKVKNMKRKLSLSKEKVPEPELSPTPKKKPKLGSYKCLIKKDTTTIKIHNGKRKLITDSPLRQKSNQSGRRKIKLRKPTAKRKLSTSTDDINKKHRVTKPLAVNNHNFKINCKGKEKLSTEEAKTKNKASNELLPEAEEPVKKLSKKIGTVNLKPSCKTAPAVLDNLFAKNNVDRVIESVISEACPRTQKDTNLLKSTEKCGKIKEQAVSTKKSMNKSGQVKVKVELKTGANRRKSKCKEVVVPQPITKVPRRSLHQPRWSNGWTWEGEPYEAKVFLNSDEPTVVRKCYPAMRHKEGDKIIPRDCVLLKAGPRKNDLPFVAKIASLWENPEDGEMMMSLLWYYRPEHTEQGRLPTDQQEEVFASRHKDSNSVACIDDKCYVLTFNEYCRYCKLRKRVEEGIEETLPCIPNPEPYPRSHRQPPSHLISPEMVFFCRRVYDFRQKRIMKNPT